jgi:hypothetical protein
MKPMISILNRAQRWLVAGAVALATAAVAVVPAHGQGIGAGFSDLATRDYLHRDMPIVAEVLELDDNQRVILDNLFEDYVDAFETGWKRIQDAISGLLDSGEPLNPDNALEMVLRPFEEWSTQKVRLKRDFESSVRSILNERQLELWPRFERRILREKTLHLGRLSGENVNLFSIVREMRMDERSRLNIEPVLDQYAVELHEALMRRHEAHSRVQGDLLQMIRSGQNLAAQGNAQRSMIALHVAVRDVNDRYRERLASSLPHAIGQELRAAALERGYPRVYRELPAMRAYRQALELEDLDEQTRADVNDLYMVFSAEMDAINTRILAAIREFEPRQLSNEVDIYIARQTGQRADRVNDPTREDLRQRNERADYYISLLRDLLGTETFAQLPAGQRLVDDATRREAAAAARQRIRERREASESETDGARRGEREPSLQPRGGGGSPTGSRGGGR